MQNSHLQLVSMSGSVFTILIYIELERFEDIILKYSILHNINYRSKYIISKNNFNTLFNEIFLLYAVLDSFHISKLFLFFSNNRIFSQLTVY